MSNMPSIKKFIDTVHDVRHQTYYIETLEDGTIVTDETKELPVLNFICTEKLHGTFAGVEFDKSTKEITALSKGNVITPEKDNAGFAMFVETNKEYFKEMLDSIPGNWSKIMLTGEWAGPGIQKGVGINEIPQKTFFMFGIRFKIDKYEWVRFPESILDIIAEFGPDTVRSIFEFKTWEIKADYNNPCADEFNKIRDEVDKESPVAKSYGITGTGEGIVCVAYNKDKRLVFKHKGESHSKVHKKKQPKQKDPKEQEKQEFADKVTPGWRLEQAVQEVCDTNNGGYPTMKDMGPVIKWVIQDIIKEETELFKEYNFSVKDIQKYVSVIVRDWFKQETEKI